MISESCWLELLKNYSTINQSINHQQRLKSLSICSLSGLVYSIWVVTVNFPLHLLPVPHIMTCLCPPLHIHSRATWVRTHLVLPFPYLCERHGSWVGARASVGLRGVGCRARVRGVDHHEHVASHVHKLVGVSAVGVRHVRHKPKPLQNGLLEKRSFLHFKSPCKIISLDQNGGGVKFNFTYNTLPP